MQNKIFSDFTPYTKEKVVRTINIGTRRHTEVACLDEPGAGGACHEYEVSSLASVKSLRSFARVSFQNGAIKESGVNGCHNEDLIAIVIDRIEHFQSGEFSCAENAHVLECLREAMRYLDIRTNDRQKRGVEGLSKV